MFNNKRLTDFTNLFSPNSFKKNDKTTFEILNSKLKFVCSSTVKPDSSGSCVRDSMSIIMSMSIMSNEYNEYNRLHINVKRIELTKIPLMK